MSYKVINGDILTASQLPGFVVICHQVNCKGVMGAGLAKQIKERYPIVFDYYRKWCNDKTIVPNNNSSVLLGNVQLVYPEPSLTPKFGIANLFAQDGYGRDKRYTNYTALMCCFERINSTFAGSRVAIPYGIGCGLAGGDWKIIETLIKEYLSNCEVEIWKKN